MPLSELRLREVPPNELEYLATHPQCVRVGATGNVVSRANSYQNETFDGRPFAGYFYYSRARNARACEDRLLYIASRSGRGRFNVQQRSNFRQGPGYVYVVHAWPRMHRPCGQYPARRRSSCSIM